MGPVAPYRQGFIQGTSILRFLVRFHSSALSNADFRLGGYTREAHVTADTGGEFVAAFEVVRSHVSWFRLTLVGFIVCQVGLETADEGHPHRFLEIGDRISGFYSRDVR